MSDSVADIAAAAAQNIDREVYVRAAWMRRFLRNSNARLMRVTWSARAPWWVLEVLNAVGDLPLSHGRSEEAILCRHRVSDVLRRAELATVEHRQALIFLARTLRRKTFLRAAEGLLPTLPHLQEPMR